MYCNELNNSNLEKLKVNEEYAKVIISEINSVDLNESKDILDNLVKVTKENNLIKAYSWFTLNLGWIYYSLFNLKKSMELKKEAYGIFKKIGDIEGELSAINGIVSSYVKQQMFDEAIHWGILGIELADRHNCYETGNVIRANLMIIYIDLEEYHKAIEISEQLEKALCLLDKKNEILNYINRSICELKINDLDKANIYINKAYEMAIESCEGVIPHILIQITDIYIERNLFDLAEEKILESIKLIDKDERLVYLTALMSYGELELKRGSYDKAIVKFEYVLENIDKSNSRRELKVLYYNLNKAYKFIKNYEKAHYYLEKYIEIEKEIYNMKSESKLRDLDKKKEEEEEKTYKALYKQTESLYEFGQMITSNLQKEDILNMIAKKIQAVINYDIVKIALYKEAEDILEYQLVIEDDERCECDLISIEEESFGGYSIKYKKDIFMNDVKNEYYKYLNWNKETLETNIKENVRNSVKNKLCNSAMFVPIIIKDKVIGVISIQCYKRNAFNLNELKTLKVLSTYIGIALENARLYKEIEHFAMHDALTNVLNKSEALKRGYEIFDCINKQKNNIATFMIDVDNFKSINDTYGHQIGDKVIENIAQTIKNVIREDDIIGRYGGEEFIVFLQGNDGTSYTAISERIRRSIEKLEIVTKYGQIVKVSVSIGVAIMSDANISLDHLINCADIALYKAKRTGKNKAEIYEW